MHAVTKTQPVPFLDLSAQYKSLEAEWLEAIRETGARGSFILGPHTQAFEKEFADYVGVKHAIAVANGTDSLFLSLRALGIGAGDEVITTPFTFFASAETIDMAGATPVFADILPDSFCLDPASVRAKITAKTRAIVPVHIFGYPSDMDEIMAIAKKHQLAVIEDCAQSFGALHNDQVVGSIGDTGSFSFYPTKVLGCYGDGGMVTTHSDAVNEHIRRLRNHGAVKPFVHTEIGTNSRLDEVQAAVLRIKLRHIKDDIAGRQKVAAEYTRRLANSLVKTPALPKYGTHVFNLYTIRVPRRDTVRQALTDAQIGSSQCYPQGLHLQDVYKRLGYKSGSLPMCEHACTQTLSLPIYPGMPLDHIGRVCDVLMAAVKGSKPSQD
ncbi:MAG: DegT/DnrJ/EryC1/StrS family aminotransferase [Sulfuricaulis sp.]